MSYKLFIFGELYSTTVRLHSGVFISAFIRTAGLQPYIVGQAFSKRHIPSFSSLHFFAVTELKAGPLF